MTTLTSVDADVLWFEQGENVVIPDGITRIGPEAFRHNHYMFAIPDGITGNEPEAFRRKKLLTVVIPDGVTEVGSWAFSFGGSASLF